AAHLFFFASRRRHTRFSRDWSSDVCSSDLFDTDREGAVSRGGGVLTTVRARSPAGGEAENHSGGDARAHEACGQGAERRVHAGFFLCCVRRGAWCRVDGGCAGGDSCPPPPIPTKATMHTSEGKSNLT